jgi:hypothetical protein
MNSNTGLFVEMLRIATAATSKHSLNLWRTKMAAIAINVTIELDRTTMTVNSFKIIQFATISDSWTFWKILKAYSYANILHKIT